MKRFSLVKEVVKVTFAILFFIFAFFISKSVVPQSFAVLFVGAAAIGIYIFVLEPLHKLIGVKIAVLKDHHEFTGFASTIFASLYGVFLAFTVVASSNLMADIEQIVNKEAELVSTLSSNAEQFPDDIRNKIQRGFAAYVDSVINDEWPMMADAKQNPKTAEKLRSIQTLYRNFHPQNPVQFAWYQQSLGLLDDLNNARFERIYSRWVGIGPMGWTVLLIGALYISIFLAFFGTTHSVIKTSVHAMVVSFITMLIYLIYIDCVIFEDPVFIKPDIYRHALNFNLEVTKPV